MEEEGLWKYQIRLVPEEISRFVEAASRCDFDVDIAYNSFVVDAKSIVGVMGLDLRYPMSVVCHGYDSSFDRYLRDRVTEEKVWKCGDKDFGQRPGGVFTKDGGYR